MTEYKKTKWSEIVSNCKNGYINVEDADLVWCELLKNRCNKFMCPLQPEYKKQ